MLRLYCMHFLLLTRRGTGDQMSPPCSRASSEATLPRHHSLQRAASLISSLSRGPSIDTRQLQVVPQFLSREPSLFLWREPLLFRSLLTFLELQRVRTGCHTRANHASSGSPYKGQGSAGFFNAIPGCFAASSSSLYRTYLKEDCRDTSIALFLERRNTAPRGGYRSLRQC